MTTTRGSVRRRPVELPVPDVERDDARRAALQQHVGEAAGRRADVEGDPSARIEGERRRGRAPASGRRGRRRDGPARRATTSASSATIVPALSGAPSARSTRTWPARISARARSRVAARPRATSERVEPRLHARLCDEDDRASRSRCPPSCARRRARRGRGCARRRPAPSSASRPKSGGVGRLAGGGVLAGRLAELGRRALDVEDVVDDLEGEADLAAEDADGLERRGIGAGHRRAGHGGRSISAPVLRACMSASAAASNGRRAAPSCGRAASRSIAWPPTMPAAPAARAITPIVCSLRATMAGCGVVAARAPARRTPR